MNLFKVVAVLALVLMGMAPVARAQGSGRIRGAVVVRPRPFVGVGRPVVRPAVIVRPGLFGSSVIIR